MHFYAEIWKFHLATTVAELQPALFSDRETTSLVITEQFSKWESKLNRVNMVHLLITLSPSIRPHRIIVWMEFLPQILPVSRDINEHDSTSCGLDSTMGFGNNRRRPASSWFCVSLAS